MRETRAKGRSFPGILVVSGLVLAVLAATMSGCGGDHSGGPTGAPEEVVTRAPDVTLGAGTARIRINAPAAAGQGIVDFATRSGHLTVSDTALTRPADLLIVGGDGYIRRPTDPGYIDVGAAVPAALAGGDPFADMDLIRGTVHILSDGGGEVEGASALRYTLTIDPGQALSTTPPARQGSLGKVLGGRTADFKIDVWIDNKLFVRRVEVPSDMKPLTPVTRVDRAPVATDVDYLAFGVPLATVQAPPTVSAG